MTYRTIHTRNALPHVTHEDIASSLLDSVADAILESADFAERSEGFTIRSLAIDGTDSLEAVYDTATSNLMLCGDAYRAERIA